MKYMLIIWDKQEMYDTATQEAADAAMQAHMEFYTFMQENYPEHTSERLNVPATGTSLRKSDGGEWVVTDGPFPESKEAIGGYYLFDAADLDEAISVAKRCPAYVGLELRPIYEYAG